MLQRLRPKDSNVDLLFLGTDRFCYFTITWNTETDSLEMVGQRIDDEAEQYMRKSQSQNKCLIDPTAKFMAMHLWEGVLNVFRMPTRKGHTFYIDPLEQVRLTELWMKSCTFLHSRDNSPWIAFLYKAQLDQEEARLAVYKLTKDDKNNEVSRFDPQRDREKHEIMRDPYASMLIPVPIDEEKRYNVRHAEGGKAHLGGLLVVGETLLTYYDSLTFNSVSSTLSEPRIYVAWEEIDGRHFFLADDFGRLDLLTIETSTEQAGVVKGLQINPMKFDDGSLFTSRASSLVKLESDSLFIASHHGDAQLVRFDVEKKTLTLIQTLDNNAPILDFAIMDMGNREGDQQAGNTFSSGQARIVAGCGAWQDGSLRSIRSGVGLDDRGILDELKGTRGLFSLRSHGSDAIDTLVISFISETRVLRFDAEGGIEEVYEFQGMALNKETLIAANLPSSRLLQITTQGVSLLDSESGMVSSSWQATEGQQITTASANDRWILLALEGRTLVSLDMDNDLKERREAVSAGDQISCLHAAQTPQEFGLVGRWEQGDITIVQLETLQEIHTESLKRTENSASVPRALALAQLHPDQRGGPTLLVALADGNVVTFDVTLSPHLKLSGRKTVTLGNSPARLHLLPKVDGTHSVFATTEHASLIYSADGRLIYSATTADDATFVAPFDSAAFPNTIVLSTDEHVTLCQLDEERLTHVKTLPMEQTIRRVAYSPALKAFGLGCIKKELIDNEEVITSSVKLVDEVIFKELGNPIILETSSALETVEAIIRAEIPDSSGNPAERFIVGTSYLEDDSTPEGRDTNGRIIVLGVDQDRQLYEILSHKLKGGCRCLGVVGDKIVAGLSKTVVVYDYNEVTTISGTLQKLTTYRPAAFPISLDVYGNMIGVIDLMQSLSLVEFIPAKDGEKAKLEERARHLEAVWATAICHIDEERWLEADAQGNILVLERNPQAPTEQDQRRLVVTSELNIGEQINKIRRLHVQTSESAVVSPKALLASVGSPKPHLDTGLG